MGWKKVKLYNWTMNQLSNFGWETRVGCTSKKDFQLVANDNDPMPRESLGIMAIFIFIPKRF